MCTSCDTSCPEKWILFHVPGYHVCKALHVHTSQENIQNNRLPDYRNDRSIVIVSSASLTLECKWWLICCFLWAFAHKHVRPFRFASTQHGQLQSLFLLTLTASLGVYRLTVSTRALKVEPGGCRIAKTKGIGQQCICLYILWKSISLCYHSAWSTSDSTVY